MKRIEAGADAPLIQCTNRHLGIYIVLWGKQTEVRKDIDDEEREVYTYYHQRLTHKPTLDEIKQIVCDQLNADAEERIISGYTWQDKQVWLSQVNQMNYKNTYDLAIQTGGKNLPYKVKLGTEYAPEYVELATINDIEGLWLGAVAHINETLADCWAKKDAVDWSVYETLLAEV